MTAEIANMEAMRSKPLFESGWEVSGIGNAEGFFSALAEINPLPVYLCFEGTSISSGVRKLLASGTVAATLEIPPGTIWPKPSVFHVLATEQFLDEFVRPHAKERIGPPACGRSL